MKNKSESKSELGSEYKTDIEKPKDIIYNPKIHCSKVNTFWKNFFEVKKIGIKYDLFKYPTCKDCIYAEDFDCFKHDCVNTSYDIKNHYCIFYAYIPNKKFYRLIRMIFLNIFAVICWLVYLSSLAVTNTGCSPNYGSNNLEEIVGHVPDSLYGTWQSTKGDQIVKIHFYENRKYEITRYDILISRNGCYFPLNDDSLLLEYDYRFTNPEWETKCYNVYYKIISNDSLLINDLLYIKQ